MRQSLYVGALALGLLGPVHAPCALAQSALDGTAPAGDDPNEFQVAPFNAPILPPATTLEGGLSFSGHLDIEVMAPIAGGLRRQSAADALLQLGGSLDTAKAGLWSGGLFEFSLMGLRTTGDLPAQTGAVQTTSNDWANNFLRVYQLTYRQDLGPAFVRAGIMDVNKYFASVGLAGQLLNASFGPLPTLTGNADIATFPTPGVGAMAGIDLGQGLSAQAGIWQANPPQFSGITRSGALTLLELARRRGTSADGQAQNVLKLGVWHMQQNDPLRGPSTGGVYGIAEHRWEVQEGPRLGVFLQLGASNGVVNAVPYYLGAGLRVERPLTWRPDDTFSLGLARANLAAQPHPETVLEVNYAYRVADGVYVQPDMQRLWHPGGINPAATVLGVRVHVEF